MRPTAAQTKTAAINRAKIRFIHAPLLEMHKLNSETENPVERGFLGFAELITPALRSTGLTPNGVTTIGLVAGLAAAYCLWRGQVVAFVVLSIVNYVADCADGYMARRYKMTSAIGDYYDHASDVIVHVALFAAVVARYPRWKLVPLFAAAAALYVASGSYLGCQQAHIQKKGEGRGETLDLLSALCYSEDTMTWARWFSTGVVRVAVIGLVLGAEFWPKRGMRF
jgi:phosphatidylglycerophosphate synthase